MEYTKPGITKIKGKLPPITTNFAPPPVQRPESPDIEDPSEDEIFMKKSDVIYMHTLNVEENG